MVPQIRAVCMKRCSSVTSLYFARKITSRLKVSSGKTTFSSLSIVSERYSLEAHIILCETYSLEVTCVASVSDKTTRLFVNHFFEISERAANSILPLTGTAIFVFSTFSHEAGTRSEYPVPVCLIRPALSTLSAAGPVLNQKHPDRRTVRNARKKIRESEIID